MRADAGGASTCAVDPAGQAAVRDYWNRRLAAPAASVPLWRAVAVTARPPLLWAGVHGRRAWVRRRRRRLGLCQRFGCDLRATTGRCARSVERE